MLLKWLNGRKPPPVTIGFCATEKRGDFVSHLMHLTPKKRCKNCERTQCHALPTRENMAGTNHMNFQTMDLVSRNLWILCPTSKIQNGQGAVCPSYFAHISWPPWHEFLEYFYSTRGPSAWTLVYSHSGHVGRRRDVWIASIPSSATNPEPKHEHPYARELQWPGSRIAWQAPNGWKYHKAIKSVETEDP